MWWQPSELAAPKLRVKIESPLWCKHFLFAAHDCAGRWATGTPRPPDLFPARSTATLSACTPLADIIHIYIWRTEGLKREEALGLGSCKLAEREDWCGGMPTPAWRQDRAFTSGLKRHLSSSLHIHGCKGARKEKGATLHAHVRDGPENFGRPQSTNQGKWPLHSSEKA